MNTPGFTIVLALSSGAAAHAAAQPKPPLQLCPAGVRVEPLRIAKVKIIDNQVVIDGEWFETGPFAPRSGEQCLWECYGRRWGPGSDGTPDEDPSSMCALGGSRWYFGDGYLQPYAEDDVLEARRGPLSALDGGWYWCPSSGAERCGIFYLWNSDTDINNCEGGFSLGDLGGVILDFGILPASCPFFYYHDTDVASLGIEFPGDRITSHALVYATEWDTQIVLAAENTQPMLWGTPGASGYVAFPGAIGNQLEGALDDDYPADGYLDPISECYSYLFDCPDPLGKMIAYGGRWCDSPCPADFNEDGFVTGNDFDVFVTAFFNGDPAADFTCDGFTTGDDFDAYVVAFIAGC